MLGAKNSFNLHYSNIVIRYVVARCCVVTCGPFGVTDLGAYVNAHRYISASTVSVSNCDC